MFVSGRELYTKGTQSLGMGSSDMDAIQAVIDANGGADVPIDSAHYRAEMDLDRDGVIGALDQGEVDRAARGGVVMALPDGALSGVRGVDNEVGYCG